MKSRDYSELIIQFELCKVLEKNLGSIINEEENDRNDGFDSEVVYYFNSFFDEQQENQGMFLSNKMLQIEHDCLEWLELVRNYSSLMMSKFSSKISFRSSIKYVAQQNIEMDFTGDLDIFDRKYRCLRKFYELLQKIIDNKVLRKEYDSLMTLKQIKLDLDKKILKYGKYFQEFKGMTRKRFIAER